MKYYTVVACMLLAFLSAVISQEAQSQTVQFGSSTSGTSLIVNMKPSADVSGYLTGATVTVRWLNSYGVSLGALSSAFGITKTGGETVSGEYKYQKFIQNSAPVMINWVAGGEYTVMSVAVTQTGTGLGVFELAEIGFAPGGDPYVEYDTYDITDYAQPFYLGSVSVMLPVELTAFSVVTDKNGATLSWKTATETNNAGFEVERAQVTAPSTVKKWSTLGFVEGNGTCNAEKHYVFKNKNVQTGTYVYRLKQIDRDGAFKYSPEVEAVVAAPSEFKLSQNYPNPFNPSTNVNFALAEKSTVTLKVYDITGREVKMVLAEEKEPGYYTVTIDASSMSSGIYFYRMTAAHGSQVFTDTKRLMVLK